MKVVHDAQKRGVDTAEQSRKRATYAVAQRPESLLRITKVNENAKLATVKLVDMEWHVTASSEATEDALTRPIEALNH